jgi:hypothetical protein
VGHEQQSKLLEEIGNDEVELGMLSNELNLQH